MGVVIDECIGHSLRVDPEKRSQIESHRADGTQIEFGISIEVEKVSGIHIAIEEDRSIAGIGRAYDPAPSQYPVEDIISFDPDIEFG